MSKYKVQDMDIIYLSYHEPQAEEFWAKIRYQIPWAKRVNGVKGFDNAHKACAKLSDTERFITIDGDCLVDEDFLGVEIEVEDSEDDAVFSWAGKNNVNGLVYGNGGAKCWIRDYVLNMKSHENAEGDTSAVDFCWDTKYLHLDECYTTTVINATPFQAFKSGFREGVKMLLDRGRRIPPINILQLWPGNINRLIVWCSVGADMRNGLWAMYGARLGAVMTALSDWDHTVIADYEDWWPEFWAKQEISFYGDTNKCFKSGYTWDQYKLLNEIGKLGKQMRGSLKLNVAELDEHGSRFFKQTYMVPQRNRLYPKAMT